MRLRLSKRFFAALMAAIASATFTSAGTATLGAAFTFSMQQAAAAEQIESLASSESETAMNVDDSGDNEASEDEESEDVEAEEELLESDSSPIVSIGPIGNAGSGAAIDFQGCGESVDNLANAPRQQAGAQPVSTSGSLLSNDLSFTTTPYAGCIAEALADAESPSAPAAIATELELATPAKSTSSESSSPSSGNYFPLTSGSLAPMGTTAWIGSYTSNISAPVSQGLASSDLPLTLLGDAGAASGTSSLNDASLKLVDSTSASVQSATEAGRTLSNISGSDNGIYTGRDLVWRTGEGTWTGEDAWFIGDTDQRTTFQDGDSVTIAAPSYDIVFITMSEDAETSTMTVKDAAKGENATMVFISDDQTGNFRLGVQRLVLEDRAYLASNTCMEVAESVSMQGGAFWVINSRQESTISADISSEEGASIAVGFSSTLTGDNSGYKGSVTVMSTAALAAKSANALGFGNVEVRSGTLSLEHNGDMYAKSLTLNYGSTIVFVGDTLLNVESLTLGASEVTWDLSKYGFSGTESDILMQGVTMDSFSVENMAYSTIETPDNILDAELLYNEEDHTVVLTYTMAGERNLIWDDSTGNHQWDGSSKNWHVDGQGAGRFVFRDDSNVQFTSTPANPAPVLQSDIEAGTMTIDNGVAVTVDTNGYDLTVGELDVNGGSLSKTGIGTATFGEPGTEGAVILNTLQVDEGTVEFNQHVTVYGERVNVAYGVQDTKKNVKAVFNEGLAYTGSGTEGYSMLVGDDNSVVLGSESNLGDNLILGLAQNATLELLEGATASVGSVYNSSEDNDNGTIKLGEHAIFSITNPDADNSVTSLVNNSGELKFAGNLTVQGAVSGNGDIVYNGTAAKELNMNGSVAGYTGSLTNASGADLTVSLGSAAKDVNMDISSTGAGKVNLRLQSADYTFGGNVAVNNISQPTTAALIVADDTSVTATGTVQTGRLVVGSTSGDAGAQFTLSGESAMLGQGGSQHTYDGVIEGYGTFTLAGGATQTFTGDLSGYYGAIVADGQMTELTLNSGNINTAADFVARNSGKLALGGNVDALGNVTIRTGSTLALSQMGASALTLGILTMESGSVLDLRALGLTGKEEGDIVLAHFRDISDVSCVVVDIDLSPDIYYALSAKDGDLVIRIDNITRNLVWRTESGTWTGTNAWFIVNTDKRATFKDGDNVTIAAPYHQVDITMSKNAETPTMTVKGAAEGGTQTLVNISDDQTGNFRLDVQHLVVEENVHLLANTRMEVTESVSMQDGAGLTISSPQGSTISANISSEEGAWPFIATSVGSTLTLTGDNSGYKGRFEVSGALVAKSANALGSGNVEVELCATLSLEHNGDMYAKSLTLCDGSTIAFVGDTLLNVESLTLGASEVTWDLSKYGFSGTDRDILMQGVTMDSFSVEHMASSKIETPDNILDAALLYYEATHTVFLTYTMAGERTLYWQGGTGNWTAAPDQTLVWHPSQDTTDRVAFQDSDSVIFDDRASLSSVTLTDETLRAKNVTVDNGTKVVLDGSDDNNTLVALHINLNGDLVTCVNVEADTVAIDEKGSWRVDGNTNRVFDGRITGYGTLTKSGSSDLALGGDNSGFHGNVMIDAGSVTVGDEHALGTNSSIHMENGTIVQGADTTTLLEMGGNTLSVDAAEAEAKVATNMNVATGSDMTFSGAGRLDVTGNISGAGSLVKNDFGTVQILGNAAYTGDTTVNAGTLAFAGGFTTGNDFTVETGGGLKLGEQAQGSGGDNIITYKDGKKVDKSAINFVANGTLTLKDGIYLDLENVQLKDGVAGVARFASLDAIIAEHMGGAPEDSYSYDFIEGVSLLNVQGTGCTTYARLAYDDTNKLLYVQTFGGTNGAYWKGEADSGEGLWFRGDKGPDSNWRTAQNGAFRADYDWDGKVPMSAYFFELTDSEGNTIDETTVTIVSSMPGEGQDGSGVGDVIIAGKTKYVFEGNDEKSYLNLNGQYPTALIVRAGAQAEFKTGITVQNGSLISVEKGAVMTIDTSAGEKLYSRSGADYVQLYNVINDGTIDVFCGSALFQHVVNNGDLTLTSYEDIFSTGMDTPGDFGSSIVVSSIYNAQGATMTLAGEAVVWDAESALNGESAPILNEGILVFNGTARTESATTTNKFLVMVPIVGTGTVKTGEEKGCDAEVLFTTYRYDENNRGSGTVESTFLELGAEVTTFEEGVNITDSTTVYSGKRANFYGGGIPDPELPDEPTPDMLGDVTLQAGDAGDATELVFGPKAVYGYNEGTYEHSVTDYTDAAYWVGQVVAGENSTLEVERGATVDIDDFNADTFATPIGEIKVGTFRDTMTKDHMAYLTIHGATAVDTITVVDNAMLVLDGNSNINRIMQGGGIESNLFLLTQDCTLNGKHDDAHGEALTGGTVTGGILGLDVNVTLTLNAVVDVRAVEGDSQSGTYMVNGYPSSKIDASNLELIVDSKTMRYRSVTGGESSIVDPKAETCGESGFMCYSGDEFVKLFDIVYTGEGDERRNVTHLIAFYDEEEPIHLGYDVYHSAASGMMTLIGDNNYEVLQSLLPEISEYEMSDYIGWGYLHTSDLVKQTYYVRDNYVDYDGVADKQVKLSQIITASQGGDEPQLNSVVFDTTEYNKEYTDYSGTLTVDTNKDGDYTKADLFSVTPTASAALNIEATDGDGKEVVVLADENYAGVQGKLDLQGAGVYEVNNRNDLGTNIALRDDARTPGGEWDGTVRVTGTSTDLTLEDKSVGVGEDASTIEFRNWNGALNGGEHTSDAKIVLTGTTEAPTAMKLTGEDAIDYTFTNTVSGSGNINHAAGGNVAMTFSGDTSGWHGTYEQLSATDDSLTFTGGTKVNANVISRNGSMDLTYGGTVETVAGDVNVYSGSDTPTTMNVTYTGGEMEVTGDITSDAQSKLNLTVGDGTSETTATFSGVFTGTEKATMEVKEGSTAVINTHAALQRVVGEAGSLVTVAEGSTLSLTSMDPKNGYSVFHNLSNDGTIEMKASGGDIRLVDDTTGGTIFNLGDLKLTDPVGTATIETYGVAGKTTNVDITGLLGPKSADQVLELTNDNGRGTVEYNLGGDTNFTGTLRFGSDESTGDANVVLNSDEVATTAVLQSTGTGSGDADVVVNTENATVLGIDSSEGSTVGGKVYGKPETGSTDNRRVTITGDGAYSYNGDLGGNLDIAYTGSGSQTFEGNADVFNGAVTVNNGTDAAGILEIRNAVSVAITELTIGVNNTLDVGTGTATVSSSVVALGGSASKLNGNLTLNNGTSYDVSAAGGQGGLDLSGSFTINKGATLSHGDIAKIFQMEIGDMYDLAFNVSMFNTFTEELSIEIGNAIDASTLFSTQFSEGEYYVCYTGSGPLGNSTGNGSNVGTVYLYKATPEPTTGTLSLLALAALAARRRRK